ncbi:MAG: SDR family oxidoreductase [Candidatus Omnitrophica bacterium]|nr:SDR family oxidoreductase [Candidatus Omnitrophota bacterium]
MIRKKIVKDKTKFNTGLKSDKGHTLSHFSTILFGMLLFANCAANNSMSQGSGDISIPDSTQSQLGDGSWIGDNPKVIIITGTASGFGKAAAEKLIAKGHVVYGGDINEEGNKYLDKIGGTALVMDVRKDDQVRAGIKRILEEQGRIDVLINNAGYGEYATIENIDIEDLKNQFDVNVFGYARLQQEVLPVMRKQRSGRIIVVSSGLGKFSMPVLGWYAASKHAVEGMADALRLEIKRFNIDVVKIQPGAANTNFVQTAYARLDRSNIPEDYMQMVVDFRVDLDALMARVGGAEETADAIVEAVETAQPEITYVTMDDNKYLIEKRNNMTEKEFYNMLSQ